MKGEEIERQEAGVVVRMGEKEAESKCSVCVCRCCRKNIGR